MVIRNSHVNPQKNSILQEFRITITRLWDKCERSLFRSADPTSLAVFRISFGILMALDIPHERELSNIDTKWGNPEICHFPLIHNLTPLPYNWMCIVYLIMWLGSMGIAIGYNYHLSCAAFTLPYWYIILLDKTYWNNHTYLFGLISFLLFFTNANACWSIDRLRKNTPIMVPFWNYFILRFQIFILYFMAGVKKLNLDWLQGYSMKNLSLHWVFNPFRLFLSDERIDYWIIHINAFLLDTMAGFGLQYEKSRPLTLILLFIFHIMNSRMFNIGMFPYVGIATMFIFCENNWPITLVNKLHFRKNSNPSTTCNEKTNLPNITKFRKFATLVMITLYIIIQFFLPFSHFITKGYNGWTKGLYGYSWDMMVHSWDTSMVIITVVDKDTQNIYYLNVDEMTLNDKWLKHADMIIQFGQCAKENLQRKFDKFSNISLHIDVWCSLNGRFHQRMYDPQVDLLTVKWSPFEEVSWIMPLLTEYSDWRETLLKIQKETYESSNVSEIIFVADFPGLHLENFVNEEFVNVTLTILKGTVNIIQQNESQILNTGTSLKIPNGVFHQVYTISDKPSCYMYSYWNKTLSENKILRKSLSISEQIFMDISQRIIEIKRSIYLILEAILNITHDLAF